MSGTFSRAFRSNLSWLVGRIDPSTELWIQLRQREVLSSWQIDSCRSEHVNPARSDKVAALLSTLERCDDEKFDSFCQALIAVGQQDVVDVLRRAVGQEFVRAAPVEGNDRGHLRRRNGAPEAEAVHGGNQNVNNSTANSSGFSTKAVVIVIGVCTIIFMTFVFKPERGDTSSSNVSVKDTARDTGYTFTEMFKGKRDELTKKIAVSPALWNKLTDKNLLTDWQVEDCQRGKWTDAEKIGCMLDALTRRDSKLIPKFCSLLTEIEQAFIVEQYFTDYC